LRAEWIGFAAEVFASVNDQGVEFIEKLVFAGKGEFEDGT